MVWLDFNQRHRIGFAFPGVLAGMIRVPNDVRHLVFLFLFFRLTCLSFHQTKKGRERRVGEGVRKVVARRFRRAVRISYPMTPNSHFVFSISSKERRWKRVWQTKKSFVSPPSPFILPRFDSDLSRLELLSPGPFHVYIYKKKTTVHWHGHLLFSKTLAFLSMSACIGLCDLPDT